jgi:hypothetical protein
MVARLLALNYSFWSRYQGSVHETESIPLTEYIPIFRVPEYSELSGGDLALSLRFIEENSEY